MSKIKIVGSVGIVIVAVMLIVTGCKNGTPEPEQKSVLLSGKFSVSAVKQVQFTKGNLYWDGTTYHIESSQMAYSGPSSGTTYDANHVGHFFWTNKTDYQSGIAEYMPYAASYSFSVLSTEDEFFCGEDNKMTVDGQSGLYTLTCGSTGEWNYLFSGRTNALDLYKKHVTVNGVPECIVIAPDDFTGTLSDTYDASAWEAAEASGIVCLPPVGYRNGTALCNQGSGGGYLSATPSSSDSTWAYGVYFPDPDVFPADYGLRSYGYAIRLVSSVSTSIPNPYLLKSN